MVWQETLVMTTVLFVATEQRPPIIYVDSETKLLQEIRPIRSVTQQDEFSFVTSASSEQNPETTTVFPEEIIRLLRSLNDKEDSISSEATTELNLKLTASPDDATKSSTTEDSSTTEGNEGFFAIFVKMSRSAVEGLVQKRSVEYLDENKNNADNLEDLDTAANTVFRPLFAYRQQNEQRRRLRTLKYT